MVFQKWECPLKFKIELEEQVNIFREVMRDLDKEFIRRLKETIYYGERVSEEFIKGVRFMWKKIDNLAGEKLR